MEKATLPTRQDTNVGDAERAISTIAGALLVIYGVRRMSPLGFGMAAAGAALAYRGITGHSEIYRAMGRDTKRFDRNVWVEHAVTVNRPVEEVYRFWRDFENLPQFMEHIKSIEILDDRRSRWVARAPLGTSVTWEAEITEDRPNEMIAWRSLDRSDVRNSGRVQFSQAPGGRGTVVRLMLRFDPPMGGAGITVAKIFGEEPSQQIETDLRRFEQIMETGEVPTTKGQPAGASAKRKLKSTMVESAVSA